MTWPQTVSAPQFLLMCYANLYAPDVGETVQVRGDYASPALALERKSVFFVKEGRGRLSEEGRECMEQVVNLEPSCGGHGLYVAAHLFYAWARNPGKPWHPLVSEHLNGAMRLKAQRLAEVELEQSRPELWNGERFGARLVDEGRKWVAERAKLLDSLWRER